MIAKRFGIIAVLLISLSLAGCVKNPETGEPEPDYPTIANVTQSASQSLSFELLKYLHANKPDEVNQVYEEFVTGIVIIQRYADGDITAGETVTSVVDIFQTIQERFDIPDSPITAFVTGTVASIAGALNMVLTEIPENAALILTAVGNGLNDGLMDYTAWASAQAGIGVMP